MYKLLQIGHYCTTGGIGVHMQRLVNLLGKEFFITVIDESKLKDSCKNIYNIRTKNFIKYLKILLKSDIVHVHTLAPLPRFLHVLISFFLFKRVILTVHSLTLVKSKFDLLFLKFTILFTNKTIVVTNEIKEKLNSKEDIVLPAFIPPDLEKEEPLPEDVKLILERHKQQKIVVGNAFRLNIYNGQDLYGTDLLIEVAETIKKNGDNIVIIFIVTTLEVNKEMFFEYQERIKKKGLENHIYLLHKKLSFVNLIKESNLVVRPTNTDGDALTIREALYLGKPVIASDVVERPQGTILFKNRDSNDLYEKIISFFSKEDASKYEKEKTNLDYKQIYKNIYLG